MGRIEVSSTFYLASSFCATSFYTFNFAMFEPPLVSQKFYPTLQWSVIK